MATHALSAPPPASPSAPVPGPPPVILKFILIGDAATGKTSLRERFIRERFTGSYRATIGCDFLGRVVKVKRRADQEVGEAAGREEDKEDEEDEARLQIWDTAGQERFRSLAPAFYRSSDACLLLYSLASPDSPTKIANSITSWYNDFVSKCPVENPRMFSWACVGTKADEVRGDPEREVRAKEIQVAVEAALEKLLPRRSVRENGARPSERKAARQTRQPPPTVSVEVLPPRNSHDSAGRRRPFFQSRSSTAQSAEAQQDLPNITVDGQPVAASKLDPDSTDRHPTLAVEPTTPSNLATTATSSATQTPKFELDAPVADLLVATSPPSAPAHFGPAGAPPAVYVGGPYRDPEGRVLGADGAQAVLDEGGGAPDHRGDRPDGRGGVAEGDGGAGNGLDELQNGPDGGSEREDEDDEEGQECELEREEARYEDEGIRHFRWTSAKTGEGVQDVFEYLARRVLAIRRAEALSEDEHAGTPYVRDSHPHRRHRHASGSGSAGAGSRAGGEDKVIKLGEREKLSVGQRMKQACCA